MLTICATQYIGFQWFKLTRKTHLQLCVSLQTAGTVDDVHQVDGGPGEGHAVAAQALAELLRLGSELLQLLLVLQWRRTSN